MINLNVKIIYLSIIYLLIIFLVISFFFWILNKYGNIKFLNTNNNIQEKFTDITQLSTNDILENIIRETDELNTIVSFDNLNETITNFINSKLDDKILMFKTKLDKLRNMNIMDKLDIGTIIMWNKDELPKSGIDKSGPTMWAWCDGKEGRPNLKYRFPLGGKDYGEEEDKPNKYENDGKLREHHIPKHRHPLSYYNIPDDFTHNHSYSVIKSGEHIHNVKQNYTSNPYTTYNRSVFEADYEDDAKWGITNIDGSHTHNISIDSALSDFDEKIKKCTIGDGPMYNGGPNPFFPLYTLVNFIIKVK